ncbi:hypothetical protein [Sphingomicrobium sediminis]|uniref:Uncharacterized protein n=1 Tax=Sphingomicrobium sediminis TaxID=2950949 RepID=A0A9X2EFY9_9SPHN|nr:hypothetical protein [Sphingomicrobium sediminis]MCM8557295.1 hypothetical protein [Sphingomicrobium sediminis]
MLEWFQERSAAAAKKFLPYWAVIFFGGLLIGIVSFDDTGTFFIAAFGWAGVSFMLALRFAGGDALMEFVPSGDDVIKDRGKDVIFYDDAQHRDPDALLASFAERLRQQGMTVAYMGTLEFHAGGASFTVIPMSGQFVINTVGASDDVREGLKGQLIETLLEQGVAVNRSGSAAGIGAPLAPQPAAAPAAPPVAAAAPVRPTFGRKGL